VPVTDYLLDADDVDWTDALASWAWLLPPEVTVWLGNRFADLFLVLPDESVYRLDAGVGSFERLAANRDEFCARIDEPGTADEWLLIPLVDALVAAGVTVRSGECYGYKTLPVLGGDYTVENCGPLPVADYLGFCGSLHEQIKNLPDGAQVELKVTD
jgi:hypothetical protein